MALNIVTRIRRWLTKLLWLLSIVVILFVLLVSVAKLALPYWLSDKERIVAFVEEQLGGKFDYQELVVDWTRFRPTIYFESLSWTNDQHTIQINSQRNTIELSLWKSLLDGYLQTKTVELNEVEVSYSILPQEQPQPFALSINTIKLALQRYPEILQQRNIALRDVNFTVRNQGQSRTFIAPQILYRREGKERQLVVDSRSQLFSSGRFVIEAYGQPFVDDNPLDIYTELDDADIQSLSEFLALEEPAPIDLVNLKLWLSYRGELPSSGYGTVFASGDQSKVAELDGVIHFESKPQQLLLQSDRFHLVERNEEGELHEFESFFSIERQQVGKLQQWNIATGNMPISYLKASVKPFLSTNVLDIINSINPAGHINHFEILAEQDESSIKPLKANVSLSDLSIEPHQSIPGIQLDSLTLNDQQGQWHLLAAATGSSLTHNEWLKQPVDIGGLQLDALLDIEESLTITLNQLMLTNADLTLLSHGVITVPLSDEQPEQDVEVALYAEAGSIDVGALHRYLPQQGIKEKTKAFLDSSLKGGTIERAKLVWRGGLKRFPYRYGSGQFYIEADVKDAVFKFAPDWPQAEQLNAKAVFHNDGMLIEASSGTLLGSTINTASATIDSFSNPVSILVIKADANVTDTSYGKLHANSPLKDNLGDAVTDFVLDKPFNPNIKITIPLGNTEPATVEGTIPFNNHTLSLKHYPLTLSQLSGAVHFNNQGAYSESLKGLLWGNRFSIDLKVDEFTKDADMVKVVASSDFKISNAFDAYQIESPLTVKGSSEFVIRYRVDKQQKQSLIARTDLRGTEIIGPEWLSKSTDEVADILVTLFESEGKVKARAIYRNSIASQLQFSSDNPSDVTGIITLGNLATQNIAPSTSGVAIRGQFDEINSYDWINSLELKRSGGFSWPEWISHIDIRTPVFDVAGQKLHEVHVTDEVLAGEYLRFKLSANEGKGSLTLYDDGRKHVQIDKLDIELLPFSKLSDSDISIEKEALHNWQLECASCRINGIDTGVLTLVTQLTEQGIALQGDSKIEGLLTAYLEGSWVGDNSNVSIRFSSPNAGQLLQRWGYGDGIKDTRTNGELTLSWPGGWHQFELVKSNGNLSVSTGKGAVKELSDRQARVFSLLSLQSIRRRLSLDFSDLFEDGFFYDAINGSFSIRQGVVHSDKVEINGATANVTISGYTDLVNNKVDQNVLVIPKLGSSLPVLAGWAIEPTTGLIMLLVNKLFEPVLDVVVSIEYKIVGDLDNPEVIELDKKSKEIVVPEEELEAADPEKSPDENKQPAAQSGPEP